MKKIIYFAFVIMLSSCAPMSMLHSSARLEEAKKENTDKDAIDRLEPGVHFCTWTNLWNNARIDYDEILNVDTPTRNEEGKFTVYFFPEKGFSQKYYLILYNEEKKEATFIDWGKYRGGKHTLMIKEFEAGQGSWKIIYKLGKEGIHTTRFMVDENGRAWFVKGE